MKAHLLVYISVIGTKNMLDKCMKECPLTNYKKCCRMCWKRIASSVKTILKKIPGGNRSKPQKSSPEWESSWKKRIWGHWWNDHHTIMTLMNLMRALWVRKIEQFTLSKSPNVPPVCSPILSALNDCGVCCNLVYHYKSIVSIFRDIN